MIYHVVRYGKHILYTSYPSDCTKINYYSKAEMRKMYPEVGYEIVGEIGNKINNTNTIDGIITETGVIIPIWPRGSMKRPFECVIGYAAIGEHTYVSVVKSIIPCCLLKKRK